jgi:enoyl-CoA hydratase
VEHLDVSQQPWGCLLTLRRPPVNALSSALMTELGDALQQLEEQRPTLVVLTGEGRCFSAGADLKEAQATAAALNARHRLGRRVLGLLRSAPYPVIAAVNGPCLGAAVNIAANCDIRVAHELATFCIPEIKRGRAGGAASLRGLLPEGFVRWMAFTGDALDAASARQLGLVQAVYDSASWDGEVRALAERIAGHGAEGLYMIKEGLGKTRGASPEDAHWIEQQLSYRMWSQGSRQQWGANGQVLSADGEVRSA